MKPKTIVMLDYLILLLVAIAMLVWIVRIDDLTLQIVWLNTCLKALTVIILFDILVLLNIFWLDTGEEKEK